MNPKIEEILQRISHLEEQVEQEYKERRDQLKADFEGHRVRFEAEELELHRRFKKGLMTYLLSADLRNILSAPFIYPLIVPLVFIDLFISIYQYICFSLYRIPYVKRRDCFVFDRTYLAYLNLIEKINCAYCSYANGLATYIKEIVARTELYWCPIKHARKIVHAHPYYKEFSDFGSAQSYQKELAELRERLASICIDPAQPRVKKLKD